MFSLRIFPVYSSVVLYKVLCIIHTELQDNILCFCILCEWKHFKHVYFHEYWEILHHTLALPPLAQKCRRSSPVKCEEIYVWLHDSVWLLHKTYYLCEWMFCVLQSTKNEKKRSIFISCLKTVFGFCVWFPTS